MRNVFGSLGIEDDMEQAELPHPGHDVGRVAVVVLEVGGHGEDLLGHEPTHRADDLEPDVVVGPRLCFRGGIGFTHDENSTSS